MNIVCTGINHRMTPLDIREQCAVTPSCMEPHLEEIFTIPGVTGAVILSTCNRVEYYTASLCPMKTLENLGHLFEKKIGTTPHLYHHVTPAAVRHLFSVASGVDSMVLGETEIFGQVKKAYALANEYQATNSLLHRLFQQSFRVAKSVRTETEITRGPVSVGSVAVELAEKIFGDLSHCRVMILGAGEVSERTARSLQSRGVRSLIVSNRNYERAMNLAAEIGGMGLHFDHWEQTAVDVDILITSTSAPHLILTEEKVRHLRSLRKDRPLFIIDLAVPRDAEPSINKLENIFLYDIDSLEKIANQSLQVRHQELAHCHNLIEKYVGEFMMWLYRSQLQ